MSDQTKEIKDRVDAKRKRVEAKIHELKADGREENRKQADQLQKQLNDAMQAVQNGYDNLKEDTAAALNNWLKD